VVVHVEAIVREALNLLQAKVPKGTTLSSSLCAGRAAFVGDPTHVHQIVMNLATNAMHAMAAGGTLSVALEVASFDAARAASVGTVGAGEYVLLRVTDTGSGIAPEIMERIFDPFFTTKEAGAGTGLGLSLVLRIVTEAGGAIDVASTPGTGSVFTVYLPRTGDAPEDQTAAEPALPRGGGQRVLVVDNEEMLLTLVTETLDELGYSAIGFTSSLAASRRLPRRSGPLRRDDRRRAHARHARIGADPRSPLDTPVDSASAPQRRPGRDDGRPPEKRRARRGAEKSRCRRASWRPAWRACFLREARVPPRTPMRAIDIANVGRSKFVYLSLPVSALLS
jgi:anti-sigma regulatory factor (Ser/Thr protein kinase)